MFESTINFNLFSQLDESNLKEELHKEFEKVLSL